MKQLLALLAATSLTLVGSPTELVVHEWGTFTSMAGADGRAVEWQPLSGGNDLPCFVERVRYDVKPSLVAKVRMETPVLYFYSPRALAVDVSVRFNQGVVTEWFPHADVTPSTVSELSTAAGLFARPGFASTAAWRAVSVDPGASVSFPDDRTGGHYYVARRTDATPLKVGATSEKFLFYRGVGGFEPPVSALVGADERITLQASGHASLGDVLLFENRNGRINYRALHSTANAATLDPLSLDGETATPQADLERVLAANGLYPAEARAMVDTWRDSWFEQGSRLFYVVPRAAVDRILPIDVNPSPATLIRVFVGRIELITRNTRRDVTQALESNDQTMLAKYARFLPAIWSSLPASERAPRLSAYQQAAQRAYSPEPAACAVAASKK